MPDAGFFPKGLDFSVDGASTSSENVRALGTRLPEELCSVEAVPHHAPAERVRLRPMGDPCIIIFNRNFRFGHR